VYKNSSSSKRSQKFAIVMSRIIKGSYTPLSYLLLLHTTYVPRAAYACSRLHMHSKLHRYLIYCSGRILIPGVDTATTRQERVISERVHHRRTGSSHSTSTTYKPEKCLLISVPVLLNADWLKILPVINSTLTCIAMR